jgi:HSP20 family protein
MSTTMTTTQPQQMQGDEHQLSQTGEQMYQATFSPQFDIWEGDDAFVLYGDLPGVDPDSLNIQFENRQLTIHGKVCRRCEGVNYMFSEYGIGDFHRSFTIGEAVNSEAISAELCNGVLTLHLPKADEAKPRRIQVNAS